MTKLLVPNYNTSQSSRSDVKNIYGLLVLEWNEAVLFQSKHTCIANHIYSFTNISIRK